MAGDSASTSTSPAAPPPTPAEVRGSPTAPPPRPRRRTGAAIAAVVLVIVIIILIVLALYLLNIGPFHHAASASSAVTFDQARSQGDSAVSGYSGHSNWQLVLALGMDLPASAGIPVNAPFPQGNCSVETVGATTSVFVPSYSGNGSSGDSPFWVLVYRNGSGMGTAGAVVTVVNGTGHVVAGLPSGSACSAILSYLSALPTVADSPNVGATAASQGGTSFLGHNSGASVRYALVGGISLFGISRGPTWTVDYTTCPAYGSPGTSTTGASFNATFNASSGALLGTANSAHVSCVGSAQAHPSGHSGLVAIATGVPQILRRPF